MNRLLLLTFLTLFAGTSLFAQNTYTFVSYNVENLFDLDGEAVFEDYTPLDKDGNSQYSPEDVYNKINNKCFKSHRFLSLIQILCSSPHSHSTPAGLTYV